MAPRTVYNYLSAEAVSKQKNAMHRRNMCFGLGGDFYLFIEQQSICCGSMDVYFFFVSVDLMFYFVWLQWEANRKTQKNVYKVIQHLNFSFLTNITKHRAHGPNFAVLI